MVRLSMPLAGLLLVVLVTAHPQAVSGQSGGRGSSSSCPENCQKIYTPLCGSDGNTYNNKCILDAASCRSVKEGKPAITVFQEGPCETREECRLDCSSTYSPVCGSNGVTYGNECWLRLARCLNPNITQKSTGICNRQTSKPSASPSSSSSSSCDERCTKIYQPVCGTNSRTYNNKCILDAASCRSTRNGQGSIRVAKDGVCEEDEGCHKNCDILYQPVCGSDGVTYDNRCLFDIAKCFNNRITVEYEGICVVTEDPVCTQACPKHGDPVCGSDGRTYSSLCQLKKTACNNKGLLSLYKGPCQGDTATCDHITCEDDERRLVCGDDGVTYHNHCQLIVQACISGKSISKISEGPCL